MSNRRGLVFILLGIGILAFVALKLWTNTPQTTVFSNIVLGANDSTIDGAANSPTLAIDPLNAPGIKWRKQT